MSLRSAKIVIVSEDMDLSAALVDPSPKNRIGS